MPMPDIEDIKCPLCTSNDFHPCDYNSGFGYKTATEVWTCYCRKCGCTFTVERVYKFARTDIRCIEDGD